MRFLRHIIPFCLAAMVSVAAAAREAPFYEWLPMDEKAPDAPLEMAGGKTVRLADFRGKVVLLNLWADWCNPCRRELPTLAALEKTWGEKGLVVLAVSIDQLSYPEAKDVLDHMEVSLPHLAKDKTQLFARKWADEGLPTTYLIGRDGRVHAKFLGSANWMQDEQKAKIAELLFERE